jgi:hypothetical protein
MKTKILQVHWAGPAIAAVLLCTTIGGVSRPAAAAPAAPVAAVTAVHVEIPCAREALAYIAAWKRYLDAWNNYENALPGGTYGEIMDAALLLEQAAADVGTAGYRLIACLAGYQGGGGAA